ncbi:MAG TPA: TetR/AcrR family transcriptional regulator [Pseudoneobacillus sp.]|nr:TetR/AcrR family transcriptional regulator [Pseudoneobacillus sp.]
MPKVSEDYKEKRKTEILDVARKVFIEKGFEFTTMTDIVEASGLSRGGVYKYFSSTDEMFWAITDEHDRRYEEKINKLLDESDTAWNALMLFLNYSESTILESRLGFGIVQYEYAVNSCRKKDRSQYLTTRFNGVVKK